MSDVKVYYVKDGVLAHYMDSETSVSDKILHCLTWLYAQLKASGWRNVRDPAGLVQHCKDEFLFLEVGNSLVAVDVIEPWFLNERVLAEEFNAPWTGNTGASVAEIVSALEVFAKAAECTMVSLGTRANTRQRGLAHLFESTGARLSTIELVKEIPYEQGSQESS